MPDSDKPEITSAFVEKLVREIAHLLGSEGEWVPAPDGPDQIWTSLARPRDGAGIWFSVASRERRLAVHGHWPLDNGKRMRVEKAPGINVSIDRGARAIAADIKRRFLPDYLALYTELRARVVANEERRAAIAALAARFGKILGTPVSVLRADSERFGVGPAYGEGDVWRAEVTIDAPDSATLDLRGQPAQIERVVRYLMAGQRPVNDNGLHPDASNDNTSNDDE